MIYANGPGTFPTYLPAPLTPASAEGYVDCCGYSAVIPKASVVVVLRCSDTASVEAVRSHCGTVSAVVVHSRSPSLRCRRRAP
jgi:hypothetical protein